MHAHQAWHITKQAGSDFFEDDAMTLGAALAFYSALSLAPLLMILLWVGSLLGQDTQQSLIQQLEQTVGPQASDGIKMVLQNANEQPNAATISGIIGIAVLLFSASGVFAQLQAAMNRIWDVKPAPGQGAWGWIRKRLLSAGMIFAILFLLLISLAVSAAINTLFSGSGLIWEAVNFVISVGVFVLLFALIFKYLPDVTIEWKYVWIGAAITAALFAVGKWAIGLYLGQAAVGSSYGAAGSLVVLLVWVYYSSLILFFGAEVTQVYARRSGATITPDKHAVWAETAPEPPRADQTRTGAPSAHASQRGPEWEAGRERSAAGDRTRSPGVRGT